MQAAAQLHYPYQTPAAGTASAIPAGIHWLRLPIAGATDHINVWLLEDGDAWLLVDTGMNVDPCRQAWDALLQVFATRPLSRIIVTHHHPDHLGLAAWLQARTGCRVWMSAPAIAAARLAHAGPGAAGRLAIAEFYRLHGADAVDALTGFAAGDGYREFVSGMPAVDRLLNDGDTVAIGSRYWQVLLVGGHAAGQINLYQPDAGLLIAGDQVLPRITSNVSVLPWQPTADPLHEYQADLQRLKSLGSPRVLPSHGGVFDGLAVRVDELLAHHAATLDRAAGFCTSPISAAALMGLLYPRRPQGLHMMLAFGETMAHVNHLQRQGRIRAAGDAELMRYVAC